MGSIWDWVRGVFGGIREERFAKRHARSGYTKTPLEMRKAKNRKRNKAARAARKITRSRL